MESLVYLKGLHVIILKRKQRCLTAKATLFAREFRVKMRYLHVFFIDNCSNFEDYLKIHKKEDQRANNLSLVRKSTWVTKMFFNLSFLKIPLQFGSQYDYNELTGEYFAITILLVIFGIVMQSFAISYERFHMDPMKRGLVNQLSTTYMAFSMCYSITRIIRYFIEWLAPKPLHHFIFNGFRLVGWFAWSGSFGCLITVNEVIFFTYWSKLWLKRVPNYNHDFLAAWLNAANVFMAFYLGGLQVYNSTERAKDEENVPRLRLFLCLGIITVLQVIVYIVHYMIDWFKTRNRTSIVPIFLDLEFDLYFFIFHYTVFHGASKMLQELQSSGEMKNLTFVIVFV